MILPTLKHETKLWNSGYKFVVGLDEAGRGPLAGPLVAAAVILSPRTPRSLGEGGPSKIIRDSKTLSHKQRVAALQWIYDVALGIGVGRVENTEIDEVGMTKAEQLAFQRALNYLMEQGCVQQKSAMSRANFGFGPHTASEVYYLIDGFNLSCVPQENQQAVIHGDQKILAIAAASIVAKEARDKIMGDYAKKYPQYGFDRHVGYGTAYHLAMLEKYGPCPLHRMSFRPLRP